MPSDHLKSQASGKIATTVCSWVQLKQQCPWEIKEHSEKEQHQGRADRSALNKTSKHLFIFYPVIKLNISKLFQGYKAYLSVIAVFGTPGRRKLPHIPRAHAILPRGLACTLLTRAYLSEGKGGLPQSTKQQALNLKFHRFLFYGFTKLPFL